MQRADGQRADLLQSSERWSYRAPNLINLVQSCHCHILNLSLPLSHLSRPSGGHCPDTIVYVCMLNGPAHSQYSLTILSLRLTPECELVMFQVIYSQVAAHIVSISDACMFKPGARISLMIHQEHQPPTADRHPHTVQLFIIGTTLFITSSNPSHSGIEIPGRMYVYVQETIPRCGLETILRVGATGFNLDNIHV